MIFHNIITKVKLFRNLLIFRGDEHGFLFLKKENRISFSKVMKDYRLYMYMGSERGKEKGRLLCIMVRDSFNMKMKN